MSESKSDPYLTLLFHSRRCMVTFPAKSEIQRVFWILPDGSPSFLHSSIVHIPYLPHSFLHPLDCARAFYYTFRLSFVSLLYTPIAHISFVHIRSSTSSLLHSAFSTQSDCAQCLCYTSPENRYYMEEKALWEIWQDFGVVGTPATDSASSIRVYAHSTETRSSAPTAVMLRQTGQREGNICSLAWGTSVVSFLLTL